MSKKVAVLFSGGLDSTYLVWKNLKEGNTVVPIYVEIKNNEVKTIIEKNRVELLVREFRKEFGNDSIHDVRYAMTVEVHAIESSVYFKQLPIWLFTIVFIQGMYADEVQIGYVSNDDAISYLDDIQNIYHSYQAICEPMIPLTFPLKKMKKAQMGSELPTQYLNLIFSCENAKIVGSKDADFVEYEPCCECVPCKTIMSTEYYGHNGFPERYKKGVRQQHIYALWREGYRVLDKDGKDCQYVLSPEIKKYPIQLEFDFYGCDDQYSVKQLDLSFKVSADEPEYSVKCCKSCTK
jgi:hypothetical protein